MEYRPINEDFTVSPQITPNDVPAIAAAGYKSIVCNRPDEEPGAWPHGDVETAARGAGLEFAFLPVISGRITPENVVDMQEVLNRMPKPVFAYCRSGARCLNLYNLVAQFAGG